MQRNIETLGDKGGSWSFSSNLNAESVEVSEKCVDKVVFLAALILQSLNHCIFAFYISGIQL